MNRNLGHNWYIIYISRRGITFTPWPCLYLPSLTRRPAYWFFFHPVQRVKTAMKCVEEEQERVSALNQDWWWGFNRTVRGFGIRVPQSRAGVLNHWKPWPRPNTPTRWDTARLFLELCRNKHAKGKAGGERHQRPTRAFLKQKTSTTCSPATNVTVFLFPGKRPKSSSLSCVAGRAMKSTWLELGVVRDLSADKSVPQRGADVGGWASLPVGSHEVSIAFATPRLVVFNITKRWRCLVDASAARPEDRAHIREVNESAWLPSSARIEIFKDYSHIL